MNIPFVRLDRGYEKYKDEYDGVVKEILHSGYYVQGSQLQQFEKEFAAFIGAPYCVGVNSGLDALKLALWAMEIQPGDEILVPANTFIATVIAITENGGRPIFIEPDAYYNMDADTLEAHITPKTKGLIVVHLYGQGANMERLWEISQRHGLFLIEDCAQSHGADAGGKRTGSWGELGCFSFYPTKGLGGFGDGKAIVCKDRRLFERLKKYRNYGSGEKYHYEFIGDNSRLDELQAGLLRVKLKYLDAIVEERRNLANRYLTGIKNGLVQLPALRPGCDSVWHLFVVEVENREDFRQYLLAQKIETGIHYPIPIHLTEAYSYLGYTRGDFTITEKMAKRIVSLPLYEGMTERENDYVVEAINRYEGPSKWEKKGGGRSVE